LIVDDALSDERFKFNALVTGDPHIRFYAGAPIVIDEEYTLGTLCAIDTKPRSISDREMDTRINACFSARLAGQDDKLMS